MISKTILKSLLEKGVNFEEAWKAADDTNLIPEGEYKVKLVDVEANAGVCRKFIQLKFKVVEGPFSGCIIYKHVAEERVITLKHKLHKDMCNYHFNL